MSSASASLVEVDRVIKRFQLRGRTHSVTAVNGVSMAVERGEVVAIVGESGSGKTTLGELLLGLTRPSAGTVRFDGLDLGALSKVELRRLRRRMQIVFQDPYASLNPYLRIGDAIIEPLLIHRIGATRQEREAMLARLLAAVGLTAEHARRYPHEFSGGQRQRIGIARALAVQPDLIVADEPVSALDVSIQAQIVNLFQDLRADYRLTIIVISHDLAVVAHLADRVYVIYLGVVMEHGRSDDVFADPRHPYTAALLSAVPTLDFTLPRQRMVLRGDVPSPMEPPSGCVFRTRCPFALDVCAERVPSLREVSAGHWKACLRDDLDPLVNRDLSGADSDMTSERSMP